MPSRPRPSPGSSPATRGRAPNVASAGDAREWITPQLDLFPVRPIVERLDPRDVVGPRTGVADLVRVRFRPDDAAHLVFHDRHGWYCEAHGPACAAVPLARGGDGSGDA